MRSALDSLRTQINLIDRSILENMARRFQVVRDMVGVKKTLGMEAYDPGRERELKRLHTAIAKELGVGERFTDALFGLILSESKRLQEEKK